MTAISNVMISIFGASWKTSLMGLVAGIAIYFSQVGFTFPADAAGWKASVVAAFVFAWGRMQKDTNVSNSPVPVAAQAVGAIAGSVVNPSSGK
jgi:glycerol uptake facilitator-like aquaporin